MNFAKLIGFETSVELLPDSFVKCYSDIDFSHWERIKQASLAFAQAGIGPQVLNIEEEDGYYCLEYQRVIPFDPDDPERRPAMSKEAIVDYINALVSTMHEIGYGHGDLHITNLGFADTVYRIEEGPVPWLEEWMREGFDWEDTFEAFVANDYDTWRTDWLE